VEKNLQNEVREYLEYIWTEKEINDDEEEKFLFSQLSETLKQRLSQEANKLLLQKDNLMMRTFSWEFLLKCLPLIKEIKCKPEQILELDDPELNSSLVFVGKGCLSV